MARRAAIWRGSIGKPIATLDTPVAIVDLDAVDRNNKAVAEACEKHGLTWRPHAKTHKSAFFSRTQQTHKNCVGICVQKLGEAEALVEAGIEDIFLSNEIVNRAKLARVAELAGKCKLSIAVDSDEGLDRLIEAMRNSAGQIHVLVDVACGHGRCGTSVEHAAILATKIRDNKSNNLIFAGVHVYHGAIQHTRTVADRRAAAHAVADVAERARKAVGAHDCSIVTGGGTGTFHADLERADIWTELQPGSYIFGDVDYGMVNEWNDSWPWEQAFFILGSVMSVSEKHAVIDSGNKCFSLDSNVGGPRPTGEHVHLKWVNGGDEHSILQGDDLPKLDTVVRMVPEHIDPTVALWDYVVGYRNGIVTNVIEIEARSRSD